MSQIDRRTLLLSTSVSACAIAGVAVYAGHRSATAGSSDRPATAASNQDRFGVGRYNTQQVADELRSMEGSISASSERRKKRILITGSTAGLGQLAASHLLKRGHRVVAHARNVQRAADIRFDLPALESVVVGDLRNLGETRELAAQINKLGAFDVIIHNSGEYGLSNPEILNANSLSAYLLTSLVEAPKESMVYLTSDLHLTGNLKLAELRGGGTNVNYNDSKLHMAVLATATARRRPELRVNAVAPGWVPTVMGFHNGPYAPDNLRAGYITQVWLAEGEDRGSQLTGKFLFHQNEETSVHPAVYDQTAQDALLAAFAERTGVSFG